MYLWYLMNYLTVAWDCPKVGRTRTEFGYKVMDQQDAADPELSALQSILRTLEPLDSPARQRIFNYVGERFGFTNRRAGGGSLTNYAKLGTQGEVTEFATLAELYDAANPQSDKDRVLVASYWLQECEGSDSFVSFAVNKELKDLGHGVLNVTGAFDALKRQRPALVLQLKKAGKSRQARKTYKVTSAGIAAVREMLSG